MRQVSFWYVCPAPVRVSEHKAGLRWLWAGPGIGDNDRSSRSSRKSIFSPAGRPHGWKVGIGQERLLLQADQGLRSEPQGEAESKLAMCPGFPSEPLGLET